MVQITWTEQSLDDLNSICLFIARDSPQYAVIFAERTFQIVEHLANFPYAGRIVPEIDDETIREVFLSSYRIIYRAVRDEITILTLHHGAKLFKSERLK